MLLFNLAFLPKINRELCDDLLVLDRDGESSPGSVDVRKNGEQDCSRNGLLLFQLVEVLFEGAAAIVKDDDTATLVNLEPRLERLRHQLSSWPPI